MKPRIAIFASGIISPSWNAASGYYRGVIRALAARGYELTVYEPDITHQQPPLNTFESEWVTVRAYGDNPADPSGLYRALEASARADIVIKTSGAGVFDELLERALPAIGRADTQHVFWDIEPAITLDRLAANSHDPLFAAIPRFDVVLTHGGGPPVIEAYKAVGARACVPIYNALDPSVHHPTPPDHRFAGDLGFLGNRLPDRETRVEQGFISAATRLPGRRFVLGGDGWQGKILPPNMSYVGHVGERDHNAFNSTPRAVLNISRANTARYGFSPATRVFAAAGAGACLISDDWRGLSTFLEPGSEVLVAFGGEHVAAYVETLDDQTARRIGRAARARVLAEHTYDNRAETLDALFDSRVQV